MLKTSTFPRLVLYVILLGISHGRQEEKRLVVNTFCCF